MQKGGGCQNVDERMHATLKAEIAKGWSGPVSERTVADILKAKQSEQYSHERRK